MYIVVEGPEASGKSTLVKTLAKTLSEEHNVRQVKEPGETHIGKELRDELLHGDTKYSSLSTACLFAFDNLLTRFEVIEPTLAQGDWVVSDRGLPSAIAYRGAGFQLGEELASNIYAPGRLTPDITIFLMPNSFDEWQGMFNERTPENIRDNIESQGWDFHRRVFDAYQALSANSSHVIDASQAKEAILQEALRYINNK